MPQPKDIETGALTEGERLDKRRGEIGSAFELHFTKQENITRGYSMFSKSSVGRNATFHEAREKHGVTRDSRPWAERMRERWLAPGRADD